MTVKLIHSATSGDARMYIELVGKALAANRFDLDTFKVLSELPAVERFVEAHPYALLPRGKALQLLLERAVAEVVTAYAEDRDKMLRKIAAFVRLRYQEGKSVKEIADAWGLDRTVVSRECSRRSLQVVSHRFLQLAEHTRWETKGEVPAAKAS